MYFNYGRSKMLYAVQVWMPRYSVEFSMFDRIQHNFLKFASRKTQLKMKYTDHDNEATANVLTMQSIFESQQLVFMYKLLNGMIESSDLLGKT